MPADKTPRKAIRPKKSHAASPPNSERVDGRPLVWLWSVGVHGGLLLGLACWTFRQASREPLDLWIEPRTGEEVELPPLELSSLSLAAPPAEVLPAEEMPATDPWETMLVVPDMLLSTDSTAPVAPEPPQRSSAPARRDRRAATGRKGSSAGRSRPSPRQPSPNVQFFGARGVGQRIIYLVDNSNSMHSGRFETALHELHQSIQALQENQWFYVMFYSDAVYGLFHPDPVAELVPATSANKVRCAEWLTTVEMCTGGQLLAAFQRAERLTPDTVFLLSDGVIHGQRTLEYMQSPGRPFVMHAIGLTVPDPLAASRLQQMAAAHGGTVNLVGVHPAARLLAQQRPIPRHRSRGAVWGIRLP